LLTQPVIFWAFGALSLAAENDAKTVSANRVNRSFFIINSSLQVGFLADRLPGKSASLFIPTAYQAGAELQPLIIVPQREDAAIFEGLRVGG
jgi:hypothetical protein